MSTDLREVSGELLDEVAGGLRDWYNGWRDVGSQAMDQSIKDMEFIIGNAGEDTHAALILGRYSADACCFDRGYYRIMTRYTDGISAGSTFELSRAKLLYNSDSQSQHIELFVGNNNQLMPLSGLAKVLAIGHELSDDGREVGARLALVPASDEHRVRSDSILEVV